MSQIYFDLTDGKVLVFEDDDVVLDGVRFPYTTITSAKLTLVPTFSLRADVEDGGYFFAPFQNRKLAADVIDLVKFRIEPVVALRLLKTVFGEKSSTKIGGLMLYEDYFNAFTGKAGWIEYPWERFAFTSQTEEMVTVHVSEGISATKPLIDVSFEETNAWFIPTLFKLFQAESLKRTESVSK